MLNSKSGEHFPHQMASLQRNYYKWKVPEI